MAIKAASVPKPKMAVKESGRKGKVTAIRVAIFDPLAITPPLLLILAPNSFYLSSALW